jgi:hypothetical protein
MAILLFQFIPNLGVEDSFFEVNQPSLFASFRDRRAGFEGTSDGCDLDLWKPGDRQPFSPRRFPRHSQRGGEKGVSPRVWIAADETQKGKENKKDCFVTYARFASP